VISEGIALHKKNYNVGNCNHNCILKMSDKEQSQSKRAIGNLFGDTFKAVSLIARGFFMGIGIILAIRFMVWLSLFPLQNSGGF
jgi:hypothetical protein